MNWWFAFALVACQSAPSRLDPPPGKLELVDAPAAQDVAPIIAREVARAGRDHKKLLVYLGAPWCDPCVKFHEAAAAGRLDQAFGDLRMLVFDADRDHEALERAGYKHTLVPLFALPGPDGRSTGHQIEGSVKGASYVQEISPRLRGLIDAARSSPQGTPSP